MLFIHIIDNERSIVNIFLFLAIQSIDGQLIIRQERKRKRRVAASSFDLPTSELWAQHASTAPRCYTSFDSKQCYSNDGNRFEAFVHRDLWTNELSLSQKKKRSWEKKMTISFVTIMIMMKSKTICSDSCSTIRMTCFLAIIGILFIENSTESVRFLHKTIITSIDTHTLLMTVRHCWTRNLNSSCGRYLSIVR
jgi:hypothetical protein